MKYLLVCILTILILVIPGLLNNVSYISTSQNNALIAAEEYMSSRNIDVIKVGDVDYTLGAIDVLFLTEEHKYYFSYYVSNDWIQLTVFSLFIEPEIKLDYIDIVEIKRE